jgi:hypothetical protein
MIIMTTMAIGCTQVCALVAMEFFGELCQTSCTGRKYDIKEGDLYRVHPFPRVGYKRGSDITEDRV